MSILSTSTPSVNSNLDPVAFDTIYRWINKRIGKDDIGSKIVDDDGAHPIHSYRNTDVFDRYKRLRADLKAYPEGLSREQFEAHFTNQATFYYTASGRADVSEVLINIDADCHNRGTPEGAAAFLDYVRATFLQDLYREVSTNGYGGHAYVVIAKGSMTAPRFNDVLRRFDTFLKAVLASGDWDVENVEVMGRPPEFTWGPGEFNLIDYKAGLLAKLPREAVERHSELMATTRITVAALNKMIGSPPSTPIKQEESGSETSKIAVWVPGPTETVDLQAGAATVAKPVKRGAQPTSAPRNPANKAKKAPAKPGSISGQLISDDQAKEIRTKFTRFARNNFEPTSLKCRHKVEFNDVAVFLCILWSFTLHPNANGAMPTKRFQVAWEDLYKRGHAKHAWNHSRFKVIRDWFSQRNQLTWIDRAYKIGQDFGHGFVKGEAAKWSAGEFLAGIFAGDEEQEKTYQEQEATLCAQKHAYPERPSDGCLMLPFARPICVGFVGQKSRLIA